MKKLIKYMLICLSLSVSFACRTSRPTVQADSMISLETLLDEMISRDAVTYFPNVAYSQKQVSSYDRRSIAADKPGWFANDDGAGYERLDTVRGRLEKVLFEEKGPGAITRIWMTTKEKFGTIRIYLDGVETPQIIIPAYDMRRFPIDVPAGLSLTHTHYVEEMNGVGGNSFFLPIPYAKSCKITFEEPDITVKIPRYYHINYRTYAADTAVRTFSLKEAERLSKKIEQVSHLLLSPTDFEQGETTADSKTLAPSSSLKLTLPVGEQAVRNLRIEVSGYDRCDYADVMRSLQIEACFDGTKTVSAPLADFSGGGMGAPSVDSWYLFSDGEGTVVSRWVMPYCNNAEISIVNVGKKSVAVALTATTGSYEWLDNSLYFHTSHNFEKGIPVNNVYDTNDNLDWNFTTINGRGIYCGDLLSLYNYAIDWYGEGDEKIWIDDDKFPSHFGTGTEDYFNCSWAPVVPFLTPYGGAPRADDESSHGYNAFMRTRNLDVIPFTEKFKYDIEMLSWHLGTVDYYTTSWWYGDLTAVATNRTESK